MGGSVKELFRDLGVKSSLLTLLSSINHSTGTHTLTTKSVYQIAKMNFTQYGLAYVEDFVNTMRYESDPRTREWFFVYDTPYHIWGVTAAYLIFVTWLGPKIMENREPLNLRWFMIIYNAFLVFLSSYMVYEIWYSAYINRYNPICQPFDINVTPHKASELRMAKALWWYFFSKFIEFMDTVLMVLRKKNNQISFLHVFHHASMLNIWWCSVKLIPGGQSWFATSANSLVHVVMYTYYLLNMFPSLRRYLWWKRYLTQFQLFQFMLILINTSYIYLTGCHFPAWSCRMLIGYMFMMLFLFGNFYVKSYMTSRKSKQSNLGNGHGEHRASNGNFKIE